MSEDGPAPGGGECPPVDLADLERVLEALQSDPEAEPSVEANVGLVAALLPDRPDYYRAAVIMRLMAFGAVVEATPELIEAFMHAEDDGLSISEALLVAVAQAPIIGPDGFDAEDLIARARAAQADE